MNPAGNRCMRIINRCRTIRDGFWQGIKNYSRIVSCDGVLLADEDAAGPINRVNQNHDVHLLADGNGINPAGGQPDVALLVVPPVNNDPFLNDVNHETGRRHNGVIGSIVLLLLMVSITLCLEISSYASPQQRDLSQLFNMIYMISGTVVMGLCWCGQFNICRLPNLTNGNQIEVRLPEMNRLAWIWHLIARNLETNCAMIFFWLFCAVLDGTSIAAVLDCYGVWRLCKGRILASLIIDLMYHFVRPIYLLVQCIFCISFSEVIFRDTWRVRFRLVVLLVTMLCIWGELVLDEAAERSHLPKAYLMKNCASDIGNLSVFNVMDSANRSYFNRCMEQETDIYILLEFVTPMFFPSMVELSVLVIYCIIRWFFSCRVFDENVVIEDNGAVGALVIVEPNFEQDPPLAIENQLNIEQDPPLMIENQLNFEQDPPLVIESQPNIQQDPPLVIDNQPNIEQNPPLVIENQNNIQEPNAFRRTAQICSFISIVLSLIVVIPIPILAYMASTEYMTDILDNYRIAFWILNLFLVTTAYCLSGAFRQKTMKFTALDILTLVSMIGPIMYQVFALIAWGSSSDKVNGISRYFKDQSNYSLNYFFSEMLDTSMLLYQVPLLYISRKLLHEHRANENHRVRRKQQMFIAIIIHLTISNVGFWILDNFLAPINASLTIHSDYYYHDYWLLITNFLNPFIIFFRFHCSVMFSKACRDLLRARH